MSAEFIERKIRVFRRKTNKKTKCPSSQRGVLRRSLAKFKSSLKLKWTEARNKDRFLSKNKNWLKGLIKVGALQLFLFKPKKKLDDTRSVSIYIK